MKAVLMEQLSWGLEPNGKNKKRVFTLAAMDIKASANLLGHDVASRHRLDIRGKPSAIAMRQVIELMRGPRLIKAENAGVKMKIRVIHRATRESVFSEVVDLRGMPHQASTVSR